MNFLLAASQTIDRINTAIGKSVSWLILLAVIISSGNAVVRKVFDYSSNAWLELQWYLYGTVFMLAGAYALKSDEHIRIDVVSSNLSKRTRDWIDLFCHVFFLMPFCILMVYLAFPWFISSYTRGEYSSNAGGLIIWPAKIMVLIGFVLLAAQGISEIIKRWAVIRGIIPDPRVPEDLPPQVREMETTMDRRTPR